MRVLPVSGGLPVYDRRTGVDRMAGRRGVKKMMKRLTERNSSGDGYFPECFKEPCLGLGCKKSDCAFIEQVCDRLADYEDTGLLPEEIKSLQAEWNINLIVLKNYRELAQADKEGNGKRSDWISVKDRIPLGGTVLATDGKIVITAPASSVIANGDVITHWMPLPGLPKKEEHS